MYLTKIKGDVFASFKVFKAKVELETWKKIKCLRLNNGGEYTYDEFTTFFEVKGN